MIPKRIFQTHSLKKITPDIARSIDVIKSMNPEYEYIFQDDQEAENWLKNNTDARTLKAYQDLLPTAFKAELWRYCVLYEYGGFYADCKMIERIPLREVIRPEDDYIITVDLNCRDLYTAVIAFVPKHPFLLKVIEGCVSNIEKRFYGMFFFEITSTIFLANKYREHFECTDDFKSIFGNNFQIWQHNKAEDNPNDLSKYTVANPDGKVIFLKQPPGYSHEDYGEMWKERHVYPD